jgi:hypothetical protein
MIAAVWPLSFKSQETEEATESTIAAPEHLARLALRLAGPYVDSELVRR